MSNPIAITPPRVPFLDKRTGDISREWFMLIQAIVLRIGGANGMSTDDLAIGALVGNTAPNLDAMLESITKMLGTSPATEPVVQGDVEPAVPPSFSQYDDIRPTVFVGTLGAQNADRAAITGGSVSVGTLTALQTAGSRIRWDVSSAARVDTFCTNPAGTLFVPHRFGATSYQFTLDGSIAVATLDAAGFAMSQFGCNGAAPQAAVPLPAAAVDLPTVLLLANTMRTALVGNGIGS